MESIWLGAGLLEKKVSQSDSSATDILQIITVQFGFWYDFHLWDNFNIKQSQEVDINTSVYFKLL